MLEWKKIGEVCNVLNGFSFKSHEYTPTGIRIIRISDVQSGYISDKDKVYYPVDKLDEFKRFILNDGDIVMSLTGNPGRVAFIKKDSLPCALNQRVACLRPKKVNGSYLYYLFNCSEFESIAYANSTGGAQKNLSTTWLNNFQIPVPSIAEQHRIVGILDTFTAAIDNLKQQIEQRRKQFEYYRFQHLSGDRWEQIMIGKLTKVFSCPRVFKDQWQDSGVPFWRSSDIMSYHNGVKNPRGEVFISQTLYEELSCKSEKIKEGDILVTGGGSIGMPYLKSDDSPLFVKDADLICIQKCSSIIPKYLYHYFLSTDFKLYLKKITHDATIAHYTINQIKDTPIPVPSLAEQSRIVGILDTFEASIANLEQQLEMREKQYEYYRNKLFTFE